jgi:hypothetical protein
MSQTLPPKIDDHFLVLAPGLTAEWFFQAGRAYYIRFRPVVLAELSPLRFVSSRRSVAVTAIARRDNAPAVRQALTQVFPRAYYDPIVYDFLEEMQQTLDGRATLGQRFGIPESP